MTVLMFEQMFVDRVRSGDKRHTIRRPRKRGEIKVGDCLNLRCWAGKAYRSKNVSIRDAICSQVSDFILSQRGEIILDGRSLSPWECQRLAVQDGFESLADMIKWHADHSGLPFSGRLIEWKFE